MDDVPVANQGKGEQQESDEQQAGGFRGINRMPLMLMGRIVLALDVSHANIVRPAGIVRLELTGTPHALAGVNSFVCECACGLTSCPEVHRE